MAVGLRVTDSSGNVLLDMSSKLCRTLGYVDTGTVDGSASISLPAGTPFFISVPLASKGRLGKGPGVTITQSSLVWDFSIPSGYGYFAVSHRIYYGVY